MKLLNLTSVALASVLLTACGGKETTKPAAAPAPVASCYFPGTPTPAPGWICDEPVPGVEISAVGISEPSKAGLSFMRDRASADARGRLAEQVKVQAQKMVKNYMGTTGVNDTETVDAASSSTGRTIANQTLYGTKVYRSIQSPDGRYFVLMGVDKANAEKIIQQGVSTSMNNDQALWQKFQSKQSFDEMAAAIAQQPMQ